MMSVLKNKKGNMMNLTNLHDYSKDTDYNYAPCRKCGATNPYMFSNMGEEGFYVQCTKCEGGITPTYNTKQRAMAAWNRGIMLNRKQRRTGNAKK